MSGRTTVILADGRKVRGFRKTLRQQSPRNAKSRGDYDLPPLWKLTFMLPDSMEFIGLKMGHVTGIVGAEIGLGGQFAHVEGRNQDWVIGQAAKLVRKLSPYWTRPINAMLRRPAEPGPTQSGPLRPAVERVITLRFDGRASVVDGNAMRQIG